MITISKNKRVAVWLIKEWSMDFSSRIGVGSDMPLEQGCANVLSISLHSPFALSLHSREMSVLMLGIESISSYLWGLTMIQKPKFLCQIDCLLLHVKVPRKVKFWIGCEIQANTDIYSAIFILALKAEHSPSDTEACFFRQHLETISFTESSFLPKVNKLARQVNKTIQILMKRNSSWIVFNKRPFCNHFISIYFDNKFKL